jgi:hypothetical protein
MCGSSAAAVVKELHPAPLVLRNLVEKLAVQCDACGAAMKRAEFAAHAQDACPVACPAGCSTRLPRSRIAAHIARECPKAPAAACPAADIGCPWRGTAADLVQHELACARHATRGLLTRIQDLEKALAEERTARAELATRLSECEKRLQAQQAQASGPSPSSPPRPQLTAGAGQLVSEIGLLYWLGTQKGTKPWANPASLGIVAVSASSQFNDPAPVTDKTAGYWRTKNDPGAWV